MQLILTAPFARLPAAVVQSFDNSMQRAAFKTARTPHGQKEGPDVLTSGPNLFEVCFEEGRVTQDVCSES